VGTGNPLDDEGDPGVGSADSREGDEDEDGDGDGDGGRDGYGDRVRDHKDQDRARGHGEGSEGEADDGEFERVWRRQQSHSVRLQRGSVENHGTMVGRHDHTEEDEGEKGWMATEDSVDESEEEDSETQGGLGFRI
jgi:hypothetical protein